LEEIAQSAKTIREDSTRHFEVACMPLFGQGLMPVAVRRFLQETAHCTIALTSLDHAALASELLKPHYDFALLEIGIQVEGLAMTEIGIGHEVCVLPVNHRLCAKAQLSPEELDGEPAITNRQGDTYRQRHERMLERAGVRWKVVVETATADTMCAMVRAGVGLAIVNPITARNHQGAGLEVRPLSVPLPFTAAICRPLGRPISGELSRFLDIIVEECRLVAQGDRCLAVDARAT
jgi:DNA-binding transcriptional LysR family regulator